MIAKPSDTPRILVIEDDTSLREGLKLNFELQGYLVTTATDGREGLRLALADEADLIVLDIMLPGRSGLEVLSELRDRGLTVPVLAWLLLLFRRCATPLPTLFSGTVRLTVLTVVSLALSVPTPTCRCSDTVDASTSAGACRSRAREPSRKLTPAGSMMRSCPDTPVPVAICTAGPPSTYPRESGSRYATSASNET